MSSRQRPAEFSGEIPEGWAEPYLVECADVIMGQSPPGNTYNQERDGLPFFQGKADFGAMYPVPRKWCTDPRRIAEPGDILMSVRAPVGPTNVADVRCIIGRGLAAIRPLGDVREQIILYAVRMQEKELADLGTGSTFTAINRSVIEEARIPLPPLAEQERIVAKLEEVLARVNNARERLAKVPAILKRFRQSVLAAACSGRLTADWREQHPDLEAAKLLLERVRATRRETLRGTGGESQRDVDPTLLPDIPETWTWVFLPELGELNRGKSRHRPRNASHLFGGPYPFIQTGDVAQSGGRITCHQQSYSEAGLAQSRLWPAGTVCITIAANIADSAILTYPACFPDSVVGIIADPDLCTAEYVEFFIRTARDDLSQFAPATAQKNINVAILGEVAVPLPPFLEQREIACRTDHLFSLAKTIEERVAKATIRADKLTQSTLARAFRGELVPTEAELARAEDRSYESAAELLERIRLSRESNSNSKHACRSNTRKRSQASYK